MESANSDEGAPLMSRPTVTLSQLWRAVAAAEAEPFAPATHALPAGSPDQRAAAIRVDRACTELRRGRPLRLIRAEAGLHANLSGGLPGHERWLAVAVETLSESLLRAAVSAGCAPQLLLSTQRLHALGWPHASTPRCFALPAGIGLLPLQQLAAVAAGQADSSLLGAAEPAGADRPELHALLALCKRAQLVPALLLIPVWSESGQAPGANAGVTAGVADQEAGELLCIDPADLARAAPPGAASLRLVSDARVPLSEAEDCRVVLFRELDGDAEHVAVVVGRPAADKPVPVRLHSACLTGDLLGSLRCDCGPQLQQAVARLAETGGVLLYLAQEGRGTGLANKLRAYCLQDTGLNTLQADRHLGFDEDERDYSAAAAMLRALGLARIHLLTNNPQKIAALRQAGIDVVERWALHGTVNAHNARYIHTKQQAGHLGLD